MKQAGIRGCSCGRVTLGSEGLSRVVDGVEHRRSKPCRPAKGPKPDETHPCPGCGGAGVDAIAETCAACRGHGFAPAPCAECGELCEGPWCSAPCEANAARRAHP